MYLLIIKILRLLKELPFWPLSLYKTSSFWETKIVNACRCCDLPANPFKFKIKKKKYTGVKYNKIFSHFPSTKTNFEKNNFRTKGTLNDLVCSVFALDFLKGFNEIWNSASEMSYYIFWQWGERRCRKTGISEITETSDIEKKSRMRYGSGGTIKVFSTWKAVANKGNPCWMLSGYVG